MITIMQKKDTWNLKKENEKKQEKKIESLWKNKTKIIKKKTIEMILSM